MDECNLGSLEVDQFFRLTRVGFRQLLNLQPVLIDKISYDWVWIIISKEDQVIIFSCQDIRVGLPLSVTLSVTTNLTD
jgi:hypothetical protein